VYFSVGCIHLNVGTVEISELGFTRNETRAIPPTFVWKEQDTRYIEPTLFVQPAFH
jgi:hypothetical protein